MLETVKSKSQIMQIICQRIPDRRSCDTESTPAALESLWRSTNSS